MRSTRGLDEDDEDEDNDDGFAGMFLMSTTIDDGINEMDELDADEAGEAMIAGHCCCSSNGIKGAD